MRIPKLFRTVHFSTNQEEILPEDKSNWENLATSILAKTLEKKLRNRISQRSQNAIQFVREGNVQQSLVFVSQMEELQDILMEIENTRKDVERRTPKAPHA